MNRLSGLITGLLKRKLFMFVVVAVILLIGTLVVTESEVKERKSEILEQAELASYALRANLESEFDRQRQILEVLSQNASTSLIQLIHTAEALKKTNQSSIADLDNPSRNPFSELSRQSGWQDFQSKLLNYLPQLHQFALLDSQGNIVLDGGGFHMASACRTKVEEGLASNDGGAMLQAHFFHDGDQHYDLIYYLRDMNQVEGAVIVKLPLTSLSTYLSRFVTNSLDIMMFNQQHLTQIVLSSYEDLNLHAGETVPKTLVDKALTWMDLPNTGWRFYFFPKEGLLEAVRQQLYIYAFAIFSMIVLLFSLMQGRWASALSSSSKSDNLEAFQLYRKGPMALFVLEPNSTSKIRYFSANQINLAQSLKQLVVVNQPFTTVLHPKEHERWNELLDDFQKNNLPAFNAKFRLQQVGDSSYLMWYVDLHVVADFNDDNECERLLVYLFTLPENQTDKAVVDELLESFPLPVFITDENGILKDANKASETFLSQNKEAFLSSPLAGCMNLESAQHYRQKLKHAVQLQHLSALSDSDIRDLPNSAVQNLEEIPFQFKNSDGTLTACEMTIQALPSIYENGFIHFLQPVMPKQVLQQDSAEPCLESYYEAALSRFNVGYHIADELEELMNFLRGVSDRLKFTFIDKVSRIHADEIRNRSDAVTRSLQDFKFLALKDEDSGKTSFDAYILVEESLHLLRLKARWHGVNIEFNFNPSCPYVWMGYENRTKQIVLQLLSYVIERLNCEEVRLNVGCAQADENNFLRMVFLLSSSNSERLLKANELLMTDISEATDLANRELKNSRSGNLLKGLDISSALIQALGGEISVNPSPNNQVGFFVNIPVEMDTLTNQFSEGKSSDVLAEQHLADKRFLLVDSDTVVEQLLVDVLERMGAQVDVVENGIDAISFWRNYGHLYSGLLIEVNAEIMDAHEVLSFIRREEEESMLDSHFPIIALVDRNHRNIDLDVFDGVIETPLIIEKMVSELKRLD